MERVVELSKWERGFIIGDVVIEELGVYRIDEGLALRANVLDAAIVDSGVALCLWRNGFGEAQGANGRLCIGDVGEVVIASGYLVDQSQRLCKIIAESRGLIAQGPTFKAMARWTS